MDRIQAALADRGIEAVLDREEIEKGEEWWARIEQLITEADTVVFVLSPDSASSPICADEVAFAEKLNKRFIPIVARDLEGIASPPALARLNYVYFTANPSAGASGDFDAAVGDLVRALETDIGWIREHTRLGALAERWQFNSRPTDLLLRGLELSAAETWLTSRPKNAPEPTDSQITFVTESRMSTTLRQRRVVGLSLAAAVVALGLAGLAYWQREVAIENETRAVKSEAQTLKVTKESQFTDSGLLAKAARVLADSKKESDIQTAVLLALEGLPDETSPDVNRRRRNWATAARFQLDRAVQDVREYVTLKGHKDFLTSADFSPDGTRIVTTSNDKSARVWDATSGDALAILKGFWEKVGTAAFSPDGTRIVTASENGDARIWDATSGEVLAELEGHSGDVTDASFSPDGTRIVTASFDSTARVWDSSTGKVLATLVGHWSPFVAWVRSAS